MNKIIAIIVIAISNIFFIGGAALLCAYKNWSLWTIFFGFVIADNVTAIICELISIIRKPIINIVYRKK